MRRADKFASFFIIFDTSQPHKSHITSLEKNGANSERRSRGVRHLLGCAHESGGVALQSQVLLEVLEWMAIKIWH